MLSTTNGHIHHAASLRLAGAHKRQPYPYQGAKPQHLRQTIGTKELYVASPYIRYRPIAIKQKTSHASRRVTRNIAQDKRTGCGKAGKPMPCPDTPHVAPNGRPQPMYCIQRACGCPCPTKHTSTPCFHLNSLPSCSLHPTSAPPQHQSTGYLTPRPAVNNMRETNLLCKGKCRRYHVPQVRTAGSPALVRRKIHMRSPPSNALRSVPRKLVQGRQTCLTPGC